MVLTNFISYMSFPLQQIIGLASPSFLTHTLDIDGENGKVEFCSGKLEKMVNIVICNGQYLILLLVASYAAMEKVCSIAQYISKRLLCI